MAYQSESLHSASEALRLESSRPLSKLRNSTKADVLRDQHGSFPPPSLPVVRAPGSAAPLQTKNYAGAKTPYIPVCRPENTAAQTTAPGVRSADTLRWVASRALDGAREPPRSGAPAFPRHCGRGGQGRYRTDKEKEDEHEHGLENIRRMIPTLRLNPVVRWRRLLCARTGRMGKPRHSLGENTEVWDRYYKHSRCCERAAS